MDLGLRGRSALVTGASRGIGATIAGALAAEGCNLHLVARSSETLDAVAADLRARHGVDVWTYTHDLSRLSDIEALCAACPTPDILVNNAGAIPQGTLESLGPEEWRAAWDLKLYGFIDLTRLILPRMSARGSGTILCIIGSAALRPNPNYIAGCMANVALNMFVSCLGRDAFEKGVRVVGINPGSTSSDRLVSRLRTQAQQRFGDPEATAELTKHMPGGRPATPEEIAAAACFLASDRSSYTSGVTLTVNGGSLGG